MTGEAPLTVAGMEALHAAHLSPATRLSFPALSVRRGRGAMLEDQEGRKLIDFHSMACVTNTGHCPPRVVQAIRAQSEDLVHANSAYVLHEPLVRLASEVVRLVPGHAEKKVAFGLSGSDANDGALKLARAATGRPKVVAFFGSYHGNTYGALSLSAVSMAMRRGFGPVVPDIHHIPFPDTFRGNYGADAAQAGEQCLRVFTELLTTVAPPEEVAAVFLEPIQGDSGILVPPVAFVQELARICESHGILVVAEEVQTGMGRTGTWFAAQQFGLVPDITILGKAFGSGMPISAIVARADLMDAWSAPGHVFSTGANPVTCAAAQATIAMIEEEGLVDNAQAMGQRLVRGFIELARTHECIGDVRGRGLMLGVDLVEDRLTKRRAKSFAAMVVWRAYELGLYLTFLSGSVLRIAPPLVIDDHLVDTGLEILEQALDDALSGRVSESDAAQIIGW